MTPTPSIQTLEKMLRDLLGRQVTVKKLATAVPAGELAWVGIYVDDTGKPAWLAAADTAFAARAGASLAMFPANQAEECIKKKVLEPGLLENYYEIVNILSALVNEAGGTHVKLTELVPQAKVPAAVLPSLKTAKTRLDCEITIAGYGAGKLALVMTT